MPNTKFQDYLEGFLGDLPSKGHRPYVAMRTLAVRSGLSRQTLYNWFDGHPGSEDKVRKLAACLKTLKAEAAAAAGVPERPGSEEAIFQALWGGLREPDVDAGDAKEAAYGFVPYWPICQVPNPENGTDSARHGSASWSFLGSVICSFLAASGQANRKLEECSIKDLDKFDVLVGLFPTPDRHQNWDFIKTPLSIPLNGVVLRQDVHLFLKHVLGSHRESQSKLSVGDYTRELAAALWQPFGVPTLNTPNVRREIQPITANDEVGWRYASNILGYDEEEDLVDFSPEGFGAPAFEARLLRASEDFQASLLSGGPTKGLPKLPVILVDEFTALEVVRSLSRKTDAVLISDIAKDAARLDRTVRPRYSLGIAFKRDHPDSGAPSRDYQETKRMLDDFVWTHTSVVAQQYARLYRELIARFGDEPVMESSAPLYFLRWLSLHIDAQGTVNLSDDASDSLDLGAWKAVLRSAASIIAEDADLSKALGAPAGGLRKAGNSRGA